MFQIRAFQQSIFMLKAGSGQGPLLGQPPVSPRRKAFGFPLWLVGGVPARVSFNPGLEPACSKKAFTIDGSPIEYRLALPPHPETGDLCNRNVILLIFIMLHRAKSGIGDFTHSKAAAYRLPA